MTVTDTRGYSTSKSVSITVEPYEPPALLSLNAYRSLQTGAQSETGAYICFQLVSSYSPVSDKNVRTMRVAFKRLGAETWSSNYTIPSDGGWVIPASIAETDEMPYQIRIVITDSIASITQYHDVAGSNFTMFFPAGGKNVSIGMAGSRTNALEINPNWKIYHGDKDVTANLSGVTPIASGGTGATNAADALTNLGACPWTHYHSTGAINSGILPVARGGTGAGSLTASRALVTDTTGNVAVSAITSTQLSYLSGLYGNVQSQINALAGSGYKIAYGSATINGSNAAIIYYSGFSYLPYIAVTYSHTGANWSGDNGCIKVYYKTTTSAYIIVGGSFATNRVVDWIAIGA